MCGRFTLQDPAKAYAAYLRREAAKLPPPRFNIAPGQAVSTIQVGEGGRRETAELLWGFVPRWAKAAEKPAPIINARAETVASKPAFREAFRQNRCLVVADGFYEWRTADARKLPYFFHFRDGRPFAFAAVWDEWQPKPGEPVRGVCLLTTAANALLEPIHERMPVILNEEGAARWLESPTGEAGTELLSLLRPFPADEMEAQPVDPWMNKADREGPRCLNPPPDDEPEQLSLF